MKRIVSLFLAIVLSLSFAVSATATQVEQTPIMPRYTYIASTVVDINIDESTNITTNDAYFLTYDSEQEVQVVCKLQRYNNSKWNTVKTWTASGYGFASVHKTWAVPSGYTYRTYATFNVYDTNGNVIESISRSDSQYFPAS